MAGRNAATRRSGIKLHIDPDGEAGVTIGGQHYCDQQLPAAMLEQLHRLDRADFEFAQDMAHGYNSDGLLNTEAKLRSAASDFGFGWHEFS